MTIKEDIKFIIKQQKINSTIKLLSKQLKINDKGLEMVLRDTLFGNASKIDWEQVQKSLEKYMPEILNLPSKS